jgi:hypothetical protein
MSKIREHYSLKNSATQKTSFTKCCIKKESWSKENYFDLFINWLRTVIIYSWIGVIFDWCFCTVVAFERVNLYQIREREHHCFALLLCISSLQNGIYNLLCMDIHRLGLETKCDFTAFVPKDTLNIVVVVVRSKCFDHILVALKAKHFPAFPAKV